MAAPNTLKEWKVAITVVGQGYESTESQYDYKTSTETTFVSRSKKMDLIYVSFHFLFSFQFIFQFSIFRITSVSVDQSQCHISHNLIV